MNPGVLTGQTAGKPSTTLADAAMEFPFVRGYLSAATSGLPTRRSLAAVGADLTRWAAGSRNPREYDGVVERTREHYARIVSIPGDRVAIGSQTSVMVSLLAAAVPVGGEVICVNGDFSSIVFPFLQRSDIRIRQVELDDLAEAITDETWLVAFALVQSATGQVAQAASIAAAADIHNTFTLCDITQAAGVLPVDATMWDATVCHAYKWLCSPRGVAFLTLSKRMQSELTPVQAGWYAGEDVWASCYGPSMHLAATARAFDVSPAWEAWVGAEPVIELFAALDMNEVWAHASGLGDKLCTGLGIPEQNQAIVTWADPDGAAFAKLTGAGLQVAARAGRVRVAFHLWNTDADVRAVLTALG